MPDNWFFEQSWREWGEAVAEEQRIRMHRDGVAITKTHADGRTTFIEPIDFYAEPPKEA